jgi:integrase
LLFKQPNAHNQPRTDQGRVFSPNFLRFLLLRFFNLHFAYDVDMTDAFKEDESDNAPPTAEQVFADFVAWNNDSKPRDTQGNGRGGNYRALSSASARLYGLFWKSFAQFLADKRGGIAWFSANPDDVRAFLDEVQPRSKREARLSIKRPRSHVTGQRYESVLNRVYLYAVAAGIAGLTRSPVQLSTVSGKTKREDEDSFRLNANYRAKLLAKIPRDATDFEARDAAIICLMLCQGLTTSEIAALQGRDVEWPIDQCPNEDWITRTEIWLSVPAAQALYVPSVSRVSQGRRLLLDPLSQKTLQNWIRVRGGHLKGRADDLLFFGNRGELSNVRIYEIARSFLLSVLVNPTDEAALETTLNHAGPMALRTSALSHWFETLQDPHEVVTRAGLVDLKSLKRISIHASDAAKDRLAAALKLQDESEKHGGAAEPDVLTQELFS